MLDGTYTIDDVQLMHDVLDEIAAVVERSWVGNRLLFCISYTRHLSWVGANLPILFFRAKSIEV